MYRSLCAAATTGVADGGPDRDGGVVGSGLFRGNPSSNSVVLGVPIEVMATVQRLATK
jgi:hypothetical protein